MTTYDIQNPIVLFDGVCNLCNSSVKFIINRDPMGKFRFASLQSVTAKNLLAEFNLSEEKIDSIVLFERGESFVKSTAVLKIIKRLNYLWPMLYVFIVIPLPIRDYLYDIVARNRYSWFGKENECMVPNDKLKRRFLS